MAALVLALAGCGGGTAQVAAPTTIDALADSASRSAAVKTGRFTFSMAMSMPGFDERFAFTGAGAYDTAAGKTEMSLDLSSFLDLMKGMAGSLGGQASAGLDADDFKLEAVLDGLVMYMRMPFLADKVPGGKEWVKIDLRSAAANVSGLDLDQFLQLANNGPQTTLEYLKAVSGEIEPVGVEAVRGTQTTRYRTAIDLRKVADQVPEGQREALGSLFDQLVEQTGLATIPVDVWVGEDGLIRRLEMTVTMTQPGSTQSVSASMVFEIFDYGKPVRITLPLASETTDVSSLAS